MDLSWHAKPTGKSARSQLKGEQRWGRAARESRRSRRPDTSKTSLKSPAQQFWGWLTSAWETVWEPSPLVPPWLASVERRQAGYKAHEYLAAHCDDPGNGVADQLRTAAQCQLRQVRHKEQVEHGPSQSAALSHHLEQLLDQGASWAQRKGAVQLGKVEECDKVEGCKGRGFTFLTPPSPALVEDASLLGGSLTCTEEGGGGS